MVPESDERQHELRQFLASLETERGFTVLVSHDERDLASVLGAWRGAPGPPAPGDGGS